MPCYWCNRQTKLTRDHVVPVCNGGDNSDTNVVWACKPCNDERGELTAFWGYLNLFLEQVDQYHTIGQGVRGLTRLVYEHPRVAALQRKWIRIETKVLGHSPSGDLCLHVPDLPIVV